MATVGAMATVAAIASATGSQSKSKCYPARR
jgi:hypothetical protein